MHGHRPPGTEYWYFSVVLFERIISVINKEKITVQKYLPMYAPIPKIA